MLPILRGLTALLGFGSRTCGGLADVDVPRLQSGRGATTGRGGIHGFYLGGDTGVVAFR